MAARGAARGPTGGGCRNRDGLAVARAAAAISSRDSGRPQQSHGITNSHSHSPTAFVAAAPAAAAAATAQLQRPGSISWQQLQLQTPQPQPGPNGGPGPVVANRRIKAETVTVTATDTVDGGGRGWMAAGDFAPITALWDSGSRPGVAIGSKWPEGRKPDSADRGRPEPPLIGAHRGCQDYAAAVMRACEDRGHRRRSSREPRSGATGATRQESQRVSGSRSMGG